MSDMEKAQILHQLEQSFKVDKSIMDQLFAQIEDQNISENFERISRGLKVEDNYKLIFSAMPWVKNINGLKQDQEKEHKENYQVPDYSLLIENSQKKIFPLLVDVKSVKGDKQSCEIMGKQVKVLQNYSADNHIPLLIAIYWEKYGYWTHNSLKNFTNKKKYKISIGEAISNDLSHILGDSTYFLHKPFYRKTLYEKNGKLEVASHETYGEIKRTFLSKDNSIYQEYSIIESAIIDSMIKMKQISIEKDGVNYTQVEVADQLPMMIKLSNWIIRLLKITNSDYSYRINGILITDYSRRFIIELMKSLGISVTYLIPKDKNKHTDYFFNTAYKDTWVINRYNSQ